MSLLRSAFTGLVFAAVSLSFFACASVPVSHRPKQARQPERIPAVTGPNHARLDLMPYPAVVRKGTGTVTLGGLLRIVKNGPGDGGTAGTLPPDRVDFGVSLLRERMSNLLHAGESGAAGGSAAAGRFPLTLHWVQTVRLSVDEDEEYTLSVRTDGITIDARTDIGVLRGIATLSQLLRPGMDGAISLPVVTIHDRPRFRWRGLLLDCARHFMPVATIKRTLLGMAAVKLNVFHWHLTDDQGFRVQSTYFPRLTEVGSGGEFYTHAQIRDIVHFADLLGIRIVPEFDMPAHASAALAAYPELGAGRGPYHVEESFGVFNAAIDPTRQSTYEALRRFLSEMTTLFPDSYVHIGGDENNHVEWAANPQIRRFMRAHGMTHFNALTRYFTSRVERILSGLGRKAVVWEEAWNGTPDPGKVVQVWAEPSLLRKAVAVGQPVLRSQRYYLDLLFPASYHYVVDPAASTDKDSAVLGGEAAMWSELVSSQTLDSRLWPRLAAIAERFWSPASISSVQDMYARLPIINRYLAAIGMKQFSNERKMLVRLSGGTYSAPLQTLADLLEPIKGYRRISTQHYTTGTPLNRTVDAIPPESLAARRFSQLVDTLLRGIPLGSKVPVATTSKGDWQRSAFESVSHYLLTWRDNSDELLPLLLKEPGLQELIGVSTDLSLIAATGLAAVDRLAQYPEGVRPRLSRAWLDLQLNTLRKADGWNRAQVTIAIKGAVTRLVYAACGLTVPTS